MLLHRGPSKKKEGVEADGADDANNEDNSGNKQSFRSDRRIVRLICTILDRSAYCQV